MFVSKDVEQIKNLKRALGLKVKIGAHLSGREKSRQYHRVQWGDVVLYQFLLDIGLMPNKSLIIGALKVPDAYFFDFLRGSFDGDGCFYSYYDPRWKSSFMYYLTFTSASRLHIDWLRDTLTRLAEVRGHISVGRYEHGGKRDISNLRYAKKEALVVLRRMYQGQNSIHLSRKRLKIAKALRIVGESLRG